MIGEHEHFFSQLGFDVHKDLEKENFLFKDREIESKLKGKVYYYQAPDYANTSFYFFDYPNFTAEEVKKIHLRIWNENRADMYFLPKQDGYIDVFYSWTNPLIQSSDLLITRLPLKVEDNDLLQKIKKWRFDSGAFWLEYGKHLEKNKNKKSTVDTELIRTLSGLREQLENEYRSSNIEHAGETIQALIDRTLFIKFLEDKHIINSFFYEHFFGDSTLTYKRLLKEKNRKGVNRLFKEINDVFNNALFASPEIPATRLTDGVLKSLARTIGGYDFDTGQLSLFDFQFDIVPIEFIGHIYQVFLEEKQAKEGIFYTPEGLVKFIVDLVIDKEIGKIIDPSCGSGVFLVMAFRQLLKNANIKASSTRELIAKRCRLMEDNIFGIEKADIARRLTVFSLYLELLSGIEPAAIKRAIKGQIETSGNCKLFDISFHENIVTANSLEVQDSKQAFTQMKFDFIIGNPPWKEIKDTDDEHKFWLQNKHLVAGKQMAQCFVIKIKDWMKQDTRCGLLLNSSNFYNETANKFQNYFFSTVTIESIYDLSGLKNILFSSTNESSFIIIFNNQGISGNRIAYYPIDKNDFTEIFNRVFIKTGDIVLLPQRELADGEIKLRDYLLGNQEDVRLLDKFNTPNWQKLEDILIRDKKGKPFARQGIIFVGAEAVCKAFNIDEKEYGKLTKEKQKQYKEQVKNRFSRPKPSEGFDIPYLVPGNISRYKILPTDCYMAEDRSHFDRGRDDELFSGERILCFRVGKYLKAVYTKETYYCSSDILVIKLVENKLYYFVQALLNSKLADYYLFIRKRKRLGNSFIKINKNDLASIPIPKNPDKDIITEINRLSETIIHLEETDSSIDRKIQDLIYKLYGLDILQRQRVEDFFINEKETVAHPHIQQYCQRFAKIIKPFVREKTRIDFDYYIEKSLPIKFCGVIIKFSKASEKNHGKSPNIKEMTRFQIMETLGTITDFNILFLPKEKYYGKNHIYIIKDDKLASWSITKAVQDAREEIRRLVN
jgi:type I restriction-modification system DNA methylase subunit